MSKKIIYLILILSIFILILFNVNKINDKDSLLIDNTTFAILVDGVETTTLPTTDDYYLVNYSCNSGTTLSWDRTNAKLTIKSTGVDSCSLEFKKNPYLYEMKQGNYVAYVGVGGTVGSTLVECQNDGDAVTGTGDAESSNSCLGNNANDTLDTNPNTYGYCYSSSYKYYVKGWRIAYIDTTNNKAVIVSAGSPECNTRTSSVGNVAYIELANTKALKYCNTSYVDGNCTCLDTDSDGDCDTPSTDAWAINDDTFYNITTSIMGGSNGRHLNSSYGTSQCSSEYSAKACGYNNDLIDNGGYYWFASYYSTSSTTGVNWEPRGRRCISSTNTTVYGLRPVISLSSSVVVYDGTGTMEDPYQIRAGQ